MGNIMKIKGSRVLVTGGDGFLGTYLVEALKKEDPKSIFVPKHRDFDFTNRKDCEKVVKNRDIVFHLAAQIGGIGFIKDKPGEIFYNNTIMGVELMEAARKAGVKKHIVMGTVCEYPKHARMPFKESDIWDGYPEETTAPYGWAKKIQIVQSIAYREQFGFNSIHLLPVNLYGPGDNFEKEKTHVIPALIKKFYKAKTDNKKEVVVWGSGKATREFLYITDAVSGIVKAAKKYDKSEPLNLGTGVETPIKEAAEMIKEIVDFKGKLVWDKSMPDGQPRRRLNTLNANKVGIKTSVKLREGLEKTIRWYKKNQ